MRQTISGVAAAIAVMTAGAAPAMACGFTACSPCGQTSSPCEQVYTPPVVNTSCNTGCGGWAYERLAEPTTQYQYYAQPARQYYYVNQGPTYSGPGAFAPYPTYQEEAVSGWAHTAITRTTMPCTTAPRPIATATACCAAITDRSARMRRLRTMLRIARRTMRPRSRFPGPHASRRLQTKAPQDEGMGRL
jgi:hypothetical protein